MKYDVLDQTGPAHAKQFQVKCTIIDPTNNTPFETYTATGSSINKAKQYAAEQAINQSKLERPTPEQIRKSKQGKKTNQKTINETKLSSLNIKKQITN